MAECKREGGLHFSIAETGWAKASYGKIYGQWLCGCESSKGLGNYNRAGYLKLRADFNQKHANEHFDYYYYVML